MTPTPALPALALALLAFSALPATAAEPASCGSRNQVFAHLHQHYRESPVAMGMANNGGMIEVLRSAAGASFTIVITMPDGVTCMIAAGENWQDLPKALARGPGA